MCSHDPAGSIHSRKVRWPTHPEEGGHVQQQEECDWDVWSEKHRSRHLPWFCRVLLSYIPSLAEPMENFLGVDLPHIRDNLRAGLTVGFISVPLSISLGVVS